MTPVPIRLVNALAASALLLLVVASSGVKAATGASGKTVFHTSRDGNFELYAMTATGADQTRTPAIPPTTASQSGPLMRAGSLSTATETETSRFTS